MSLKKSEQVACEAIDTMLRHKVALGLQDLPEDAQKEEEHSFQYLHEQINEMFAIKAAGLTHHDGACAAFRKIHNYKYITDATFRRSVDEEMQAQGIPPGSERASNTVTECPPSLAKRWAAVNPAGPEPTTATRFSDFLPGGIASLRPEYSTANRFRSLMATGSSISPLRQTSSQGRVQTVPQIHGNGSLASITSRASLYFCCDI